MKDELDSHRGADAKLIDFTSKRVPCQSAPHARQGGCQAVLTAGRARQGSAGERKGGREGREREEEGVRDRVGAVPISVITHPASTPV